MKKAKIIVKGTILTLNTLDRLEKNKKVFIDPAQIRVSDDNRIKVYKKAQYLDPRVTEAFGHFILPIEINNEGNYEIDFSEVTWVVTKTSIADFEKLDPNDWIEDGPVTTKQVRGTKDVYCNYSFIDLQNEFFDVLVNDDDEVPAIVPELKKLLTKHIKKATDTLLMAGFEERLERKIEKLPSEVDPEDADDEGFKAYQENIRSNFQDILDMIKQQKETFIEKEPTEEEKMQADLDSALKSEDYNKAIEIRDAMQGKGYTPKS